MITAQELRDYKTIKGQKQIIIEETKKLTQALEEKAKKDARCTPNYGYVEDSIWCNNDIATWFYGNVLCKLANALEALGYAILISQDSYSAGQTKFKIRMFWTLEYFESIKTNIENESFVEHNKYYPDVLLYATDKIEEGDKDVRNSG